jgi:hypothetical protein
MSPVGGDGGVGLACINHQTAANLLVLRGKSSVARRSQTVTNMLPPHALLFPRNSAHLHHILVIYAG